MLSFLLEDFEVAEQSGRSRLLMPGVSWLRLRADNEIRPTAGSKLSLEIRGANDGLVSDTSFVQTVAQGIWIWSRPTGQRFLVRGQAGATAKREFAELPASVRFFAGGDNSVRGYGFEELGPVDADGNVIGGSSLLTGSFEFEQPLRERWSLAFFVDSGNAFETSNVDAKTGVGLGGRWRSPLGPIRIDLAVPLDDETESYRFHFSLGPDL
jgi:translocation and assembly module TamA